jgi:hypothetical protein
MISHIRVINMCVYLLCSLCSNRYYIGWLKFQVSANWRWYASYYGFCRQQQNENKLHANFNFVWAWNLVCHMQGRTNIEGICSQSTYDAIQPTLSPTLENKQSTKERECVGKVSTYKKGIIGRPEILKLTSFRMCNFLKVYLE